MTNHEFMRKAEARVVQCWKKLNKQFKRNLPAPRVYFDLRSRRIAGEASDGRIRFNLAYVPNNGEEMLNQTVPHEVAHVWLRAIGDPSHVRSSAQAIHDFNRVSLGMRRTRRSPHGPTFMRVLGFLGGRMERTHNMKVDATSLGRRGVTWKYKCECRTHEVSTIKHNKMRRGQTRICKYCRANLVRA